MRRLKYFVLISSIILLTIYNCDNSESTKPKRADYLEDAWEKFSNGNYQESLWYLNESLSQEVSVEAQFGKGWRLLLIDTTEIDEVIENLEPAKNDSIFSKDSYCGLNVEVLEYWKDVT